jgi:triphosphoribosyl-dephospho-CoA synthetase
MDTIENESENINGEEMEIIKKSFEDIKEIKPIINSSNDLNLGFNKFNSESKKILKKLFVIHKKKMYTNFIHTKSYNDLQEIINNITFNDNDLSSPPSILSTVTNNNFIINNNKKNNEVNYKSILDDMNCFIRDKLKNQFTSLNSYIQTLTENLYGRKIRVSLIGNISVGKSTVLNAIIGEDILPTKDSECTYRGVIIKHKNIDKFLLYRTKLKIIGKGAGYNEYYNFEEDPEPYCSGIQNIKSYLKNKNSDQRIEDQDAFIVIQGRLKIFDFIKLDNSLIDKIEFIDLPGHDRQNNTFNSNRYYEKILKFSNSCIYINEAKSIDDEDSVARLKVQYISDKQKLYSNLQPKFINSCLFLINKADYVPKEEDRTKIKKSLIRIISQVEPNASSNIINISFFSAKYFNDFLFYSKVYVNIIENNPYNCLLYLYNKWSGERWYLRNFKNYIVNKVSDQIEDKFDLDLDEDNISQIPLDFYNKLKTAFNKLYSNKHRGIDSKEEDAVIKKLYCIYKELKNKDFSKTNYSTAFFDKLKEVILYSDKLQKENLNNSIEAFFKSTDELFNRELKEEIEEKRKKSEEKYYLFKDGIIPKIKELINKKEEKIKDIISNTKKKCLEIMDDEIKNYESRIKDAEYEIKKAGEKLEKKIQKELEDMKQKQEEETKTLLNEILELSKELINAHYNAKSLSPSEMEEEKGETTRMIISIITSALSAIATTTGIILSSSVFAGMAVGAIATTIFTTIGGALMGGLGLLGGVVVGGLLIGFGIWFNRSKIKDQYKENLEKNKNDLIKKFDDILNDFSSDFRAFKDSLIKEMNIKVDVFYKNIDNIDTTEWENLKKEYNSKRDKTRAELKNLFK